MFTKVLGFLLAFSRFVIAMITIILWLLAYSISWLWRKRTTDRDFALRRHWLTTIATKILNLKIAVEGKPQEQPALYVCNHRSFSDPAAICKYLDAFVIAKAEVANYPILNTGARITGVLYVKREDKSSRNQIRDTMISTIKSGRNVLVFPEGTVGYNQKTLPFKVGSFYAIAEENLPVVPIAIEYRNPSDMWVNSTFARQIIRQFSKWEIEIKLSFGEPYTNSDGGKIQEYCQTWIDSKLVDMQNDWSRVEFTK